VSEPGAASGGSEQVEIARAGLAAFSRGDLEDSLQSMHPDVEWHLAFRLPDLPADKDVFHGHDEVRTLWRAFRSVWEELTIELEEVVWEAPGTLVLKARFRGKGQGSGVEVDRVLFYVMRIQDQMLVFTKAFDTADEALAEAGAPTDA
jgi:ketosteroid isomerase-like protein